MRMPAECMATLSDIALSLSRLQGQGFFDSVRDLCVLLEANPSPAFAQNVLLEIPLPLFFGILQSCNSHQALLVCGALDKILSKIPASELIKNSMYIELGLQNSDPSVKKLCLAVLNRTSQDPEVIPVIVSPTMFHLLTLAIADDDLQCAKIALAIVLQFISAPAQLTVPVREALVIDLLGIMDINTTVRYRVYELVVQAVVSEGKGEVIELVLSGGFLSKLLQELDQNDILAQLNCIELLLNLQDSEAGPLLLETGQVLDKLYSLLLKAQQDPLGTALIPGLIKFFGHMVMSNPRLDLSLLLSSYPEFLRVVFRSLPNPQEDALWGIAVDTFGILSSTESSRELLKENMVDTTRCLKSLGFFLSSGSSEVCTRVLRCLAMVASCPESSSSSEESTSVVWFRILTPKPCTLLMSIAKKPFADLRHSALKVMLSMASYEWGQREMLSHGGFLEYLLDRHTEPDKEGKELKHDIVHAMVESPTAEQVWGNVDFLKLRKFDREGPFYFITDASVAANESSL